MSFTWESEDQVFEVKSTMNSSTNLVLGLEAVSSSVLTFVNLHSHSPFQEYH